MKRIILFTTGLLLMLSTMFVTMADTSQPLQEFNIVTEESDNTVVVSVYAEFAFTLDSSVLDSLQFDLEYDAGAFRFIECSSIAGAPESDVLDSSFLWSANCVDEGTVTFASASVGGTQNSGLVARFIFSVVGEGKESAFTLKNVAYSTYDTAANAQTTYKFAEFPESQGDAAIGVETIPAPDADVQESATEESVSGWTRFIRSIFGDSCCAADGSH